VVTLYFLFSSGNVRVGASTKACFNSSKARSLAGDQTKLTLLLGHFVEHLTFFRVCFDKTPIERFKTQRLAHFFLRGGPWINTCGLDFLWVG
jgi:hypothetical protein